LQRLSARIMEGRSGRLTAAWFRVLKELGLENQ
jgi:hypothetical protein